MGLGFRWFKEYEITHIELFDHFKYNAFYIDYLDGDSTSHSYYNVQIVQDLFEEVCGKRIPVLPYESEIDSIDYKLNLIEPEEMISMCDKVLSTSKVDEIDMRDRIEWFKKCSEDGYYIAYDWM